jgi:hypothetical protein
MSSNSSNSSTGGVILNPPVKKQCSPAIRWCFTFNNYTETDVHDISSKVPELCKRYIIAKEVGDSGTPHLQGYIEFHKKCRPKNLFSERIHWEKSKGTPLDNASYCSKEGNVILSYGMPRPVVKVTYDMLRPWQKVIADKYKEFEDPLFGREIHWYFESEGNVGKSVLCKYFIDCCDALVISGNQNDIKHGIASWIDKRGEGPPIVVLNIPRSSEGYISYPALEQIKDGFFFSGKYESNSVRFNSPHLICFANHKPDLSMLSADRWKVSHLLKRLKSGETVVSPW